MYKAPADKSALYDTKNNYKKVQFDV